MSRHNEIILGDKRAIYRLPSRFSKRLVRITLALLILTYLAWSMEYTTQRSKVRQALVDISRIEHVARLFRVDLGRCPDNIDEMVLKTWEGKYEVPVTDPWGYAYRLRCPAPLDPGGVMVTSGGPDGSQTVEDDIHSI